MRVYRAISEPVRTDLSFEERWRGEDRGLIVAWEVGRNLAEENEELRPRLEAGELPSLGYKGGITRSAKTEEIRYGSLLYLAAEQGILGQDLDIDSEREYTRTCSRFGRTVIFTRDTHKLGQND